MSADPDRLRRLQAAYSGASLSALQNLPESFERDAVKAGAFMGTWAAAEDLAGMLQKRVLDLSRRYREPFPGILGPGFDDLARQQAGLFLKEVRRVASVDGVVSREYLYAAFHERLEGVRALEKDVQGHNRAADLAALMEVRPRHKSR